MVPNTETSGINGLQNMGTDRLITSLVEFYRRLACRLPEDIHEALRHALDTEAPQSPARATLEVILENVRYCREHGIPLCQDTGIPVFDVTHPERISRGQLELVLLEATRRAVRAVPLRPNAVVSLTGVNTGDGVGEGIPMLKFHPTDGGDLVVAGMLKGGGCENVTVIGKLPDASLGASRDMDGVRRCVLDAVWRAQGRACPPYVVGVGIAGAVDSAAALAKHQLMRPLNDVNSVDELDQLERRLVEECNRLGIGAGGMGGRSTVLGVKAGVLHRHPASYFVAVSFACWACRRGTMTCTRAGKVTYDL